jgi:hypothetical protein
MGSRGKIQFRPTKPRGFTGSRGQRGIRHPSIARDGEPFPL